MEQFAASETSPASVHDHCQRRERKSGRVLSAKTVKKLIRAQRIAFECSLPICLSGRFRRRIFANAG